MKIGVFGDSFATDKKFDKFNETPTWIDILNEKHDVTIHAIRGSNLYYAVEQFIKFHEYYDKIVFIVTEPGRQQIADWIPLTTAEHKDMTRYRYVVGPAAGEYFVKMSEHISPGNFNLKAAYQTVVDYFKYMQMDHYDNYIHNLMCDDVLDIRSDTVMIPAFKISTNKVKKDSLIDIYLKENAAWGYHYMHLTPELSLNYTDRRNCHMTAENNAILAEKVEQWMNGEEVVIDVNDFATPMNKEFYIVKNNERLKNQ